MRAILVRLCLVAVSSTLAGCGTTANLFPVDGPIADSKETAVLKASVTGILGNTGDISLTYPDGSICQGKWASAAPTVAGFGSTSLIDTYGNQVLATGSYVGIKPGVNRGEAFVVCDNGRKIEAEFFTGSGTANGYGVAKDTDGNLFKMIF